MAAQVEKGKTPPYVSFTTFTNALNKLREIGVPNRIDASVFPGQSGSGIAALLGALKFLKLVDEVGTPDNKLRQLVEAKDEDRGALLKPLLLERYEFITKANFDLKSATTKQVEQAFRDQGIEGSTVTKSVGFFLAAAQLANLTMSPHVKAPKPPRGSGATKRRRSTNADSGSNAPPAVPPPPAAPKTPGELLLAKFPEFDPTWPDELKKSWFSSFAELHKTMTSPTGKKGDDA